MSSPDSRDPVAVAIQEIKQMFEDYITRSLMDPDLAQESEEFRRGWARGMREGLASALQLAYGRRRDHVR